MTKCIVLVDNSNVFIEGKKYSAFRKGILQAADETRVPQDPSWRLDFGKLLHFMADGRELIDAILVGSEPPRNDSVWESARREGFRVHTYKRSMSKGDEKEVDTEIATQAAELIVLNRDDPGILVLGSGDRDFLPSVRCAHRHSWTAEMCAFTSAFTPTGEMALAVDLVRDLDTAFDAIGRYDFDWPT